MAISGVGQDIKPHMLWVSQLNHVRLHSQCSNRLKIECEDEEGGEIRESETSLAQGGKAINQEVGHDPVVMDSGRAQRLIATLPRRLLLRDLIVCRRIGRLRSATR